MAEAARNFDPVEFPSCAPAVGAGGALSASLHSAKILLSLVEARMNERPPPPRQRTPSYRFFIMTTSKSFIAAGIAGRFLVRALTAHQPKPRARGGGIEASRPVAIPWLSHSARKRP